MLSEIKFSIIIRIYNAELYLSRQIESVLSQTYSNWELILVDDGSTDHSSNICDEFAEKNEKIKVIHQENSGCTCATLKGLQKANGDYCLAIDADDWLETNLLEIANSYLENNNYDILEYGIRVIKDENLFQTISFVKNETSFTKEDFFKFTWNTTLHSLWTKLIRKNALSFTNKELEYFTKNKINQNEDMLIGIPYILSSDKIKVIPDCLYNYVIYEDSVSHGIEQVKKIKLAFETCNTAMKLLEDRGVEKKSIKKLVINELYREIFPILPYCIIHRRLNRKTILDLKSYRIYEDTSFFVFKYGLKEFLAWVLFRIF